MDIERLKVDADYWDEVAPSGAQEYCPPEMNKQEGWRKVVDGMKLFWTETENWHETDHPERTVIPRPTKTEWTPERQAMKTLWSMDYTYSGGEYWKPPIGEKPGWLETEWVDGLPSVGEECEAKNGASWRNCFVTAIGYDLMLCYDANTGEEYVRDKDPANFRPIRTPEEKQREELVKTILDNVDKKEFASVEWAEHARRVIDQSVDAILSKYNLTEK